MLVTSDNPSSLFFIAPLPQCNEKSLIDLMLAAKKYAALDDHHDVVAVHIRNQFIKSGLVTKTLLNKMVNESSPSFLSGYLQAQFQLMLDQMQFTPANRLNY